MSKRDHSSPAAPPLGDGHPQSDREYSHRELRSNRTTIVLFTIGFIVCSWVFSSGTGAIVLTVIGLVTAAIFWRLFASPTAVKLDDDSVGMGKDVGPVTMGTILGYLYNGFKR